MLVLVQQYTVVVIVELLTLPAPVRRTRTNKRISCVPLSTMHAYRRVRDECFVYMNDDLAKQTGDNGETHELTKLQSA